MLKVSKHPTTEDDTEEKLNENKVCLGLTKQNILELCSNSRANLFNTILCFHFLTIVLDHYAFMLLLLLQNTRAQISKQQSTKIYPLES